LEVKMAKKHAHYSLYRKRVGTRDYWYVRYWDEREKRYTVHRSTGIEVAGKKERRAEAEKIALEMLPSICFNTADMTLIQYINKFWRPDSPYFREHEKVYDHKLTAYYSKSSLDVIRLHVEPYEPFSHIGIEKLTAGLIRDWMLWCSERGVSGIRINKAMQAIRVALRYAIDRDEAKADPFTKIKAAHEKHIAKGVLTKNEVIALINAPATDVKHRLAVLLGALCGMRLGEVRGLHWEDFDPEAGVIHIRHNWQDMEGIKEPKYGSCGDVPLPSVVHGLAEDIRAGATGPLVFGRKEGKPHCNGYFRLALIRELAATGINKLIVRSDGSELVDDSEQRRRNITFHSLRHTFVSLAKLAGVGAFQAQALARHKKAAVTDRYSHPQEVVEIAECGKIIEGFFRTA
jgi:integrase